MRYRVNRHSDVGGVIRTQDCLQTNVPPPPRSARDENSITEDGEVRVAWELPDLYMEDEDITDEYEVGISTGVKKAV